MHYECCVCFLGYMFVVLILGDLFLLGMNDGIDKQNAAKPYARIIYPRKA